ncbi:MAG: hypothetical protein PHV82_16975, partial [Victivallaceae bacterium]|nr:hypothetical protein [Victivallaceae bacterium]
MLKGKKSIMAKGFSVIQLIGLSLVTIADGAVAPKIKVGVFIDQKAVAVESICRTLEKQGMEAEKIKTEDIEKGNIYDLDVIYFGGGFSRYDWLSLKARMHLVEFTEKRGGGIIFSMFRCGGATRSLIRPIFPEIAHAYRKANGFGVTVVNKNHPVTKNLPVQFYTPFWDHAVLEVGSR